MPVGHRNDPGATPMSSTDRAAATERYRVPIGGGPLSSNGLTLPVDVISVRQGVEAGRGLPQSGDQFAGVFGPVIIKGAQKAGSAILKALRPKPSTLPAKRASRRAAVRRKKQAALIKRFSERFDIQEQFNTRKSETVELNVSEVAPGEKRETAIQDFIEAWRSGDLLRGRRKNAVARLRGEKIDPDTAAKILRNTELDVSGMFYSVDTNQLNHAFNRHGPGNEKARNQVPLTPEAVSRHIDVIENYDRISVRQSETGPTIKFEMDVNGVTVVVEQVRRGKRRLSFHTMWVEERS